MSTIYEVMVATQLKLNVTGFSVVTDVSFTEPGREISHDEVIRIANERAKDLTRLIKSLVTQLYSLDCLLKIAVTK